MLIWVAPKDRSHRSLDGGAFIRILGATLASRGVSVFPLVNRGERRERERGWVGCSLLFGGYLFSLYFLLCLGFRLYVSWLPCYNYSCWFFCFAVSVLASSSVFAGVVAVGFSGSRSPSAAASAALSALLPLVPSAGVRLSVGCAAGVDSAVSSWFGASPSLLVFSVASGRFGSGRSAFARRSSRCVLSVASGSRGLLVVLPSAPVPPAGVRPSRSFFGGGSGSWGSVCFALGRGRRALLWLPSGCLPPSWSGVSWSSAGGLGCSGCWWLGVAVPAPVQLSLF